MFSKYKLVRPASNSQSVVPQKPNDVSTAGVNYVFQKSDAKGRFSSDPLVISGSGTGTRENRIVSMKNDAKFHPVNASPFKLVKSAISISGEGCSKTKINNLSGLQVTISTNRIPENGLRVTLTNEQRTIDQTAGSSPKLDAVKKAIIPTIPPAHGYAVKTRFKLSKNQPADDTIDTLSLPSKSEQWAHKVPLDSSKLVTDSVNGLYQSSRFRFCKTNGAFASTSAEKLGSPLASLANCSETKIQAEKSVVSRGGKVVSKYKLFNPNCAAMSASQAKPLPSNPFQKKKRTKNSSQPAAVSLRHESSTASEDDGQKSPEIVIGQVKSFSWPRLNELSSLDDIFTCGQSNSLSHAVAIKTKYKLVKQSSFATDKSRPVFRWPYHRSMVSKSNSGLPSLKSGGAPVVSKYKLVRPNAGFALPSIDQAATSRNFSSQVARRKLPSDVSRFRINRITNKASNSANCSSRAMMPSTSKFIAGFATKYKLVRKGHYDAFASQRRLRLQQFIIGANGFSLKRKSSNSGPTKVFARKTKIHLLGATYIRQFAHSKHSKNVFKLDRRDIFAKRFVRHALQRSLLCLNFVGASGRNRRKTTAPSHSKFRIVRPERKRELCMFYNRYGRCVRGQNCKYIHNPTKIAICKRFLRGTCEIEGCPFAHKLCQEKMPACAFYLKGRCKRENCPYLHMNVTDSAAICADFNKGSCPKGMKCDKLHKFFTNRTVRPRKKRHVDATLGMNKRTPKLMRLLTVPGLRLESSDDSSVPPECPKAVSAPIQTCSSFEKEGELQPFRAPARRTKPLPSYVPLLSSGRNDDAEDELDSDEGIEIDCTSDTAFHASPSLNDEALDEFWNEMASQGAGFVG